MALRAVHGPDMLLDRVDDNDHVIGQVVRSKVFSAKANFRVSHVLIFNHSGSLLLQRLAGDRERHPFRWGSSVASYVPAGASYEDAARDRIVEELGMDNLPLSRLGKTVMDDNACRKFVTVFTAQYEGPINFDRSHIAEVKYMSLNELIMLSSDSPDACTPTFDHIMTEALRGRLR